MRTVLHTRTRLKPPSVVYKVAGIRPSRGEMRDLLQAQLLTNVGKIVDVQTLGRSFYQIDFETPDMFTRVLQLVLSLFELVGILPMTEVIGEVCFPVSLCLPRLRREYLYLLPKIGGTIGTPIETIRTAASVTAKATELPSIRVLVADPSSTDDFGRLASLAC